MKIFTVLTTLSAAFLIIGCETLPKQEFTNTPLPQQGVILTVLGLSCPLCSNNLDGQLDKIENVKDIAIDLNSGAVTVEFENSHTVTEKQLSDAVKAAGFTLAQIQPIKK